MREAKKHPVPTACGTRPLNKTHALAEDHRLQNQGHSPLAPRRKSLLQRLGQNAKTLLLAGGVLLAFPQLPAEILLTPTPSQTLEEEEKYRQALEAYRKNPTALKTLLTEVWTDLGLPRHEAEKFVQDSFQNPHHAPADLNKKASFYYAEKDLLHQGDLEGLKNYLAIKTYGKLLFPRLIHALNTLHCAQIPAYETFFPEENPESAQAEIWAHIEAHLQLHPESLQAIRHQKQLLDTLTKEQMQTSTGWAIAGDNIYILKDSVPAKTLFQIIVGHEALHTAQKPNSPTQILETIAEFRTEFLSAFLEKDKESQKKLSEDLDYFTNPKEISAWSAMIKKIYFQQTHILLTPRSTASDFDAFLHWAENPLPEEEPYKENILQQFQTLKRLLEDSPKTKKLLWEHLKDVAHHHPKKSVGGMELC